MATCLACRWTLLPVFFFLLSGTHSADEPPADIPENARSDEEKAADPLPPGALARFGSPLLRHGRSVTGLAFSRDGKRLVSCSQDYTVRVWDAENDRELLAIQTHASTFTDVALSPDGRTIAAATGTRVWVWSSQTGEMQHRFDVPDSSVAFSPDGKVLLACGGKGGIRHWDLETGKPAKGVEPEGEVVKQLRFSADGKWLAGSGAEHVFLWNWKEKKLAHTLKPKAPRGAFTDVCFSSTGDRVAAIGGAVAVSFWSTKSGEELDTFSPGEELHCLAFSADDRRIFVSLASGEMIVRKLDEKEESFRWQAHWLVKCLAVSPDGKTLVTGGSQRDGQHDFAIRKWPVDHRPEKVGLPDRRSPATGLALSADGRRLAVGHSDGWAHVYDTETGRLKLESHRPDCDPNSTLALSPDGKWLARGGQHNIAVLNVTDAADQFILETGDGAVVRSLTFTPDGKYLAGGNTGGRLFIWDFARRTLLHKVRAHDGDLWGMATSPDGSRIATTAFDGQTALWNTASGQALGKWKTHDFLVRAVAFSPDGTRVASGSDNHKIAIVEVATGEMIRQIDTGWSVTAVGFCDGGRTLVSGHFHDRLKFWDLASGELLLETRHRPGPFTWRIAMRRDRPSMYAAHSDSTAVEWDLQPALKSRPKLPPVELAPDRAEKLWKTLAAGDAPAADRALWEIVAAGDAGAAMLKEKLKNEPAKIDEAAVDKLIKQLDDDDFQTRQAAETALQEFGTLIKSRLERELRETKSAEVGYRVERLLRRLEASPERLSPQRLQASRAIYALAAAGTPAAQAVLKAVAEDDARYDEFCAAQAKLLLEAAVDAGPSKRR